MVVSPTTPSRTSDSLTIRGGACCSPRTRDAGGTVDGPGPGTTRQQRLLLVGMALSMSIWFIDDTAVTVALPTIERYFDVSSTATQWTITAYLLAAATGVAAAGASPLCQRHACLCSRGRG